ncbi:MAG: 30S ribosomal protein S1 [Pirellulaceae bacterium]|nr:30S ribosomal protein S1 [Pirellulaceae bacterium]
MVDRNLIRELESDAAFLQELEGLDNLYKEVEDQNEDWSSNLVDQPDFVINNIVDAKVLRIDDHAVLVDVGFKSEASVLRNEWEEGEELPNPGDTLSVLIEDMEDNNGTVDDPHGMIKVSKRKAERILDWQKMMDKIEEGQTVTGKVLRKIKGGLLVDIGVNVFLPASQVDIRRPNDIADYIGQDVDCEVLKIDEERRNIVVSRRSLIEKQRQKDREQILQDLSVGQVTKGIVKNIADFGAFVDLGGIDGLLHITDMSWERINHPSQMVEMDQEVEVMILEIDLEKEKIALGMKQKDDNPWEGVDEKYSVGTVTKGSVVNVMSYGAFVKIEAGIEGLVHISEMSWTKRISHPNEMVQIGDEVEVSILNIDASAQQLSLGMKQTQKNPWEDIDQRYPENSMIKGRVRNITNYGAFIELEEGIDGLLHVSDMSWTRKISHPSEMLDKGQEIECKVISVDKERRRIALGLKQLEGDPWATDIPERYQPNKVVTGKVTKVTNFGVFVSLEAGLEGLLHISELADHKVENPEDVVKVGEDIEVKILRVDTEDRKIGLSKKRVGWTEEQEAQASEEAPDTENLKGGLGGGGPLIESPEEESATDTKATAEATTPETPAPEDPTPEASDSEGESSAEESEET